MDISVKQFFEESDLLDNFYEFHPDWFDDLSDSDLSRLDDFYGFKSHPDDLLNWCSVHVGQDPKLEAAARGLLMRILQYNGLQYP